MEASHCHHLPEGIKLISHAIKPSRLNTGRERKATLTQQRVELEVTSRLQSMAIDATVSVNQMTSTHDGDTQAFILWVQYT